jgi:hypothetical protein
VTTPVQMMRDEMTFSMPRMSFCTSSATSLASSSMSMTLYAIESRDVLSCAQRGAARGHTVGVRSSVGAEAEAKAEAEAYARGAGAEAEAEAEAGRACAAACGQPHH